MILKCNCKRDRRGNAQAAQYQDKKYGSQMRVHNQSAKSSPPTYRCTICGQVRSKS